MRSTGQAQLARSWMKYTIETLDGSWEMANDAIRSMAVTGYVLAADAWGNGYATEALQAMVDVSHSIGLLRISALCHPQHRASWRVLEKCGFTRDESWSRQEQFPNLARGVSQDVVCYELILGERSHHRTHE